MAKITIAYEATYKLPSALGLFRRLLGQTVPWTTNQPATVNRPAFPLPDRL